MIRWRRFGRGRESFEKRLELGFFDGTEPIRNGMPDDDRQRAQPLALTKFDLIEPLLDLVPAQSTCERFRFDPNFSSEPKKNPTLLIYPLIENRIDRTSATSKGRSLISKNAFHNAISSEMLRLLRM